MSVEPDSRQPSRPDRRTTRRRRGLLLAALVAALALVVTMPVGPQHHFVREEVIAALTNQTGRQVRVGSVWGSLWQGLIIDHVSIAGPGGFGADNRDLQLTVDRVRVRYHLLTMLRRRDVLSGISSVILEHPEARLVWGRDGKVDLFELFRRKKPPKPGVPSFEGRVRLSRGMIIFLDEQHPIDGQPRRHDLRNADFDLRFLGPGRARLAFESQVPGTVARVNAGGLLALDGGWRFEGQAGLHHAKLEQLAPYLNPPLHPHVELVSGELSVTGKVRLDRPKDAAKPFDSGFDLDLVAEDCSLRSTPFAQPGVHLTGRARYRQRSTAAKAWNPDDGVWFDDLNFDLAGSRATLNGRLVSVVQPSLDLRLRTADLRPARLALALTKPGLFGHFTGDGLLAGSIRLGGRRGRQEVSGWIEPRGVGWEQLARLDGGRVTLDLKQQRDGADGWSGRVELQGVQAASPRLAAPLEAWRGRLDLAGDRLRLVGLAGRLGTASLQLDGQVSGWANGRRPDLDLKARVNDLSPLALGPLLPAKWEPRAASGGLSGSLAARGTLGALALAGDLRLPGLTVSQGQLLGGAARFDVRLCTTVTGWAELRDLGWSSPRLGAPLTGLTGRLELAGGNIAAHPLTGRLGGDPLRVEGTVRQDFTGFNLALDAPDFDLGRVLASARPSGLAARGRAMARVRLSGAPDRFRVAGSARLPYLRGPGWQLGQGRFETDLEVRPKLAAGGLRGWLRAEQARLRVPSVAVPVSAETADLYFAGDTVRIARFSGAIAGDPVYLSGRLNGLPRVRTVDLSVASPALSQTALAALVKEPPVRLDQPVAADLTVSGSWPGPRVRGSLAAAGVSLAGESPLQLAGALTLDLTLNRPSQARPPLPAVGTVRLRQVTVRGGTLGTPVEGLDGWLRLARDGSVTITADGERLTPGRLVGRLGASEVMVGGLALAHAGAPWEVDLSVDAPSLAVADVRSALRGMDPPPDVTGDGQATVNGLRVSGSLDHLRIISGAGQDGWVGLPARLAYADWQVAGGRARLDLSLTKVGTKRRLDGTVEVDGSHISGGGLKADVAVTGRVRLAAGRLAEADVDGRVGGGTVRLAARAGSEPDAYGTQVSARGVALADLLPDQRDSVEALAEASIDSDLTVEGPLGDLTIRGQLALATRGQADPARLTASLRLVKGGHDDRPRLLGRARLAGGDLRLASLDEPLRDLRGEVRFTRDRVAFDGVTALLAQAPLRLDGLVTDLPAGLFDLTLAADPVDLGAWAQTVRVAPADDPQARVTLWQRWGLPALRTPGSGHARLVLRGPRQHVTVAVEADLPRLTLARADAVPTGQGLETAEAGAAEVTLATNLRLRGQALGSLGDQPLPTGDRAAALLEQLAGLAPSTTRLAEAAPPAAAEKTPLAHRFSLDLRATGDGLRPRQVLALTTKKSRDEALDGLLGDTYAFAPGTLSVTIGGQADAPEVEADLRCPRWQVRDLPVREVSAHLRLAGQGDDRLLSFTNLSAQVRGGTITGSGALRSRHDQPLDLEGRFKGEGLELAALNALGLSTTKVEGIASADLALQLTRGRKLASGVAHVQRLRLAGERVGDGEAQFGLADEELTLERLLLRDPDTNAFCRLQGRLGLRQDGALALSGDVRGFELDRLTPLLGTDNSLSSRVSGRLDFAGEIGGTRRYPLIGGVANVFFGSVAGVPFTRLSLRSTPLGERAMTLHAELSDSAYTAALDGTVNDLDSRAGSARYALEGVLSSHDLGQIAPLAAPKVPSLGDSEGTVAGRISLTGRAERRTSGEDKGRLNALADLRGTASLHLGGATRGRLRIAGIDLDSADLAVVADANEVRIDQLEFATGSTRVALKPGTRNAVLDLDTQARLELHLVSPRLRYDDLVGLTRVPLRTEGYVDGEAEVSGLLREPTARVSFSTHGLRIEGEPLSDRVVAVRLAKGELRTEGRQAFDLFGVRAEVDGGWIDSRPEGEVRLVVHDLPRLRRIAETVASARAEQQPRLWQSQLRGWLDAIPEMAGGRVEAAASLERQNGLSYGLVAVACQGLKAVGAEGAKPLPPLVAAVQVGTGGARTKSVDAAGEPGTLYITGSATLDRGRPESLSLHLATDDLDLRPYAVWSSRLRGLAGVCSVSADLVGPARKPEVRNGRLAIADLALGQVAVKKVSARKVGYRDGMLSFEPLEVEERSLLASISGRVPLERTAKGLRLIDDPARPVDLRGGVDVFDLSDFGDLMGSIGWVEGNAKLELAAQGRASEARVTGAASLQAPLLQVVDRPGAKPAGVAPKGPRRLDRSGEVVLLHDAQMQLSIDQNQVRVEQCSAGVVPVDYAMSPLPSAQQLAKDRAAGRIGRIEVREPANAAGGTDPALVLRHFEWSQMLDNPLNVDVLLEHVNARSRYANLRDANLTGQIRAETRGGVFVANELRLPRCEAWLNDGFARLTGNIVTRVGDPRRWSEQEFHLRLTTPALDPRAAPGSAEAEVLARMPKSAAPRPQPDGRVVYPVQFADSAAGLTRITADVGLDSHTETYGPLTLWGKLQLSDTVLREGALALLSADPRKARRDWPAAPELRLAVTVPEAKRNRLLTRVPAIDLPFSAGFTLSETPQRLRLDGTVDVASGSVYASVLKAPIEVQNGTATLRVQRNPLTGAFEPHAEFDSRSETVLRATRRDTGGGFGAEQDTDYRVSLRVRGTVRPGVDKPETEFRVDARSTPSLPEEVIFARLSTSNDFAQALEKGTLETFVKEELANAAVQTAITYAFTPVFEEIRKGIGLDEFSVVYELNRPFEVRVGKYLVRNLFAGAKVSVNERGESRQVFRVSYQISNAFRATGQADMRDDYRLTVEYQAGF